MQVGLKHCFIDVNNKAEKQKRTTQLWVKTKLAHSTLKQRDEADFLLFFRVGRIFRHFVHSATQEQMAVKQLLWGGEKFVNDLGDVTLREVYFLFRLFLLDI